MIKQSITQPNFIIKITHIVKKCQSIKTIIKLFISLQLILKLMLEFDKIQEEVEDIIDEVDHPNIIYISRQTNKKKENIMFLTQKYQFPIQEDQSIRIIKDVLEGIVQLQSHLIIHKPCQIMKEHVVEKDGRWGICNLICYRDPHQSLKRNPSRYWPIDFDYHPDEDAELIWSIGRLWYELLTNKQFPPIKKINQKQIGKLIENIVVREKRIIQMLKNIFIIKPQQRVNLNNLIDNNIFQFEAFNLVNTHSMIPRSSLSTSIDLKLMFMKKKNIENPFLQQLFMRDFRESLVIVDFYEKVKKQISNIFRIKDQQQQIDFSCYLIDLKSYKKLNEIENIRKQKNYELILLTDKNIYKQFIDKSFKLQAKIRIKRKMRKFTVIKSHYPYLFCEVESIDIDNVNQTFYEYITYYVNLMKNKQASEKICGSLERIKIQLLIVKHANLVFGKFKKQIFGDANISGKSFDLSEALNYILNSDDGRKLKLLKEKLIQIEQSFQNQSTKQ